MENFKDAFECVTLYCIQFINSCLQLKSANRIQCYHSFWIYYLTLQKQRPNTNWFHMYKLQIMLHFPYLANLYPKIWIGHSGRPIWSYLTVTVVHQLSFHSTLTTNNISKSLWINMFAQFTNLFFKIKV